MSSTRLTAAVVLLSLLTTRVRAQRETFVEGFHIGGEPILTYKAVQAELKVSPEQAAQLDFVVVEAFRRLRDEDRADRDLPMEEQLKKRRERRQIVLPDLHRSVAGILNPDQIKRFAQIQIQASGIAAYYKPRVRDALKLTDDQVSKIKTLYEQMAQNANAIILAGRNRATDPEEDAKKVAELQKRAALEAHALLTESQQASLKEMMGAPFEVGNGSA
jgi:hypothetical protein